MHYNLPTKPKKANKTRDVLVVLIQNLYSYKPLTLACNFLARNERVH